MILKATASLLLLVASTLLASTLAAQPSHHSSTPHPRCATPYLIQHAHAPEKTPASLLDALDSFCPGPSEQNGRPIKQRNILTPGGHFRVHFDTEGENAVAPRDLNGNNIPDYIDSVAFYLEYAWQVEVVEMGYAPPPPDNRGPGPEVDVFICNLSLQFYGGAQTDNNNVIGQNPTRVHGYLVLDNDYVGYPARPMAALRVTTAHEFHHIIEFSAYRTALAPYSSISQFSLYEATATWMEEKVHPDVDDWRQYVEELLQNPQNYGFSTHNTGDFTTGYGHMLYITYLERKYGPDVIREIWEEFRTRESFPAIDAVLMRRDFNLSRSYCEFGEWSYYTGYRARDTSLLKEAPGLPALRPVTSVLLDGSETAFEDELYPLSFGLYRLLLPAENVNIRDTVDFLVTNSRSNIGAGGPALDKEPFRVDISRVAHADYTELNRGDRPPIYYRLRPLGSGSTDVFCLDVISDQINTVVATRTSPQPFINKPGESLLFAVPGAAEEVQRVKLWIYSPAMRRVAEVEQFGLQERDNQLGVLWNGEDMHGERVPSGIYIYEMSVNGATPVLGKFAVIRESAR